MATTQPSWHTSSSPTEFEAFPRIRRSSAGRATSTNSTTSQAVRWIARMFARSPAALNEKRESLLSHAKSKSSSEASSARSSMDLESQASTLLEMDREKKPKSSSRVDARVVSDAIIGLSDGLTVPFALTAGLSALGNTRVVIFAGLAELTAGAISMGLGGYLAAKSEEESYKSTLNETRTQVSRSSSDTLSTLRDIFEPYDLPPNLAEDLTYHLSKSPNLTQFLMNFQHNLPEQEASRAVTCALTIASGYFLGGFLPLIPYFLVSSNEVLLALYWSFGFMALSLFAFGYGKTCFCSSSPSSEWFTTRANLWAGAKGGVQMMLVGGTAAVCAMSLVRVFDSFAAAGDGVV